MASTWQTFMSRKCSPFLGLLHHDECSS